MTKNTITDYLKVQLNRAYENENYFVDGDDFLDNGLEDYTEYSHNWQSFYNLWNAIFAGSEYEGLLGLQLFVVQNMRVPNHMYGLNRVSYHAPSDDDIIKDIKIIKAMGFNGVRMHQKIEDSRFYYWCDKLGLAVWAELPSGYCFSDSECNNLLRDMGEFISRDYNHPSIIVWVPLNESWGVRNIYSNKKQQNFALALYNYIKYRDQSRLCDTNDGWEQVTSDICSVHDYVKDYSGLKKNWENIDKTLNTSVQNRKIYSEGFSHSDEPILITEFGGIAFNKDINKTNWGYSGGEESEESFLLRFNGLIKAIKENESIAGFCYTQLTDVMQEVNGIVKINREEKVALDKIREIVLS